MLLSQSSLGLYKRPLETYGVCVHNYVHAGTCKAVGIADVDIRKVARLLSV